MSGEFRIYSGKTSEILLSIFRVCKIIFQPVIILRTPFFTYIRNQAILEPVTDVEQHSILYYFLEVVAM